MIDLLTRWETITAAAVGLIATLTTLWKMVGRPMWNKLKGAIDALNEIPTMKEEVTSIRKEMHPNGGSSLRDQINRMDDRTADTHCLVRGIMKLDNQAMWVSDARGRIIDVNITLCRMVGRSVDEFLGASWLTIVAQHDRIRVSEEWRQAVTVERPFEMEFDMVTPEGEVIPVVTRSEVMRDECGRLRGGMTAVSVRSQAA